MRNALTKARATRPEGPELDRRSADPHTTPAKPSGASVAISSHDADIGHPHLPDETGTSSDMDAKSQR
jgi:hypothetical protein